MGTTEHAVVIAGGGPTGMVLAAELALAGVDVAMVERRPDHALAGSRAGGFHARALELFDQRGIAERFLAEGKVAQVATLGTTVLDMGDVPTRHPYTVGIWQNAIERILAGWVAELPVEVLHGREVTGVGQDEAGVDIALADGQELRTRYLVGDGGRSLVRKAAGIAFPGWEATRSAMIAEVEATEELPAGLRIDVTGVHALGLMGDGPTVRVVVTEQEIRSGGEPTLGDLAEALEAVFGTDFGVHSPTWISRFTDATRQAAAYRAGRVLLAGDAAHVHWPVGGQGLGLGVHDAMNLGWKLAQVVHGTTPDGLLDTYHAGEGHGLLGRRMPDLDLVTEDGPLRVFALLHTARPLLLDLGAPGTLDATPWSDRVQLVRASCDGPRELPVVGTVPAPAAVLVRPDGHVAWVGDGSAAGLHDALTRWFGPPSST